MAAGLIIGGVALGTAAGGVAGFFVADKVLKTRYEALADAQIEQMRLHYLQKQQELADQPKKDLEDLVKEAGYKVETKYDAAEVKAISDVVEEEERDDATEEEEAVSEAAAVEEHNVFSEGVDLPEWDWKIENHNRIFTRPYVIHKNEFDEGVSAQDPQTPDYEQATLTYFEEDDVLADERDTVIGPVERSDLVGDDNLRRFGHGSGDANVVYIRNNPMKTDFEIVLNKGSYAVQVHGFLEHAEPRRRTRLKFDDE